MLRRLCRSVFFAASFSLLMWSQAPPGSALLSALNEHRYAEAVQIADSALKTHPADPWLWTLRGMALEGAGETAASLESLNKALSLDARYAPALKAASQIAYQHHDPRASAFLGRLLALYPDQAAAHAMAGVLDFEAHNCTAAIAHFQKSAQFVLSTETSATEYAACLLKEHRTADAIELLKRAHALFPASRNLRYDLGLAQTENGQSADALATLQPAPDDDPGILNLRASIESSAGNLNAAFLDLKRAVEMDTQAERNYLDMALLCLDHNQEQRAADVLTVGIVHLPQDAVLYAVRGIAYAELSRYDDAEKDFGKARDLDPKGSFSELAHSVLYAEKNQPEQVEQSLRQQLHRTPDDPVLNTFLADLLMRQGASPSTPEFSEAKAAVAHALKTNPQYAEALILQAKIDSDENNLAGALDALERAAKVEPDNHTVLNQMLLILRKLGRKQDSVRVAQRLKNLVEEDARREQDAIRTTPGP
jgi:tetratricopeptide (TPR) repeat protein